MNVRYRVVYRYPTVTPQGCALLIFVLWAVFGCWPAIDGEWWSFLVLGAPCLLSGLAWAAVALASTKRRSLWAPALLTVSGALAVAFSFWRRPGQMAFVQLSQKCVAASDVDCFIRAATHADWSFDRKRAAGVLRKILSDKARLKIGQLGSSTGPNDRSEQCLIWEDRDRPTYAVKAGEDETIRYRNGEGPVTVFLVRDPNQHIIRSGVIDLLKVCAVRFDDVRGAGTPLGCHDIEVPLAAPPDPTAAVERWIKSLPIAEAVDP